VLISKTLEQEYLFLYATWFHSGMWGCHGCTPNITASHPRRLDCENCCMVTLTLQYCRIFLYLLRTVVV
jgi:hypothetical protein